MFAMNISIDGCYEHTHFFPSMDLMDYFTQLMRDTGLIVYGITYYGVRGFQARRRAKLMDRARERMTLATENAPSV